MKKIMLVLLASVLFLAVPTTTQAQAAQKEINAGGRNLPF